MYDGFYKSNRRIIKLLYFRTLFEKIVYTASSTVRLYKPLRGIAFDLLRKTSRQHRISKLYIKELVLTDSD